MTLTIQDAANHLVHSYPGGADSLAPRLHPRKASGVLSAEVKLNPPSTSTAKLGLETAVQLTELAGNPIIVQAFCRRAGGVFLPLPGGEAPTNDQVWPVLTTLAKEFGDMVAAAADAARDGRVTDNELARVSREALDLIGAIYQALQVLGDMNAAIHRE